MDKKQRHEFQILSIMQRCVHFTGIQHDECKASVSYHGQFGNGVGCFANIPCVSFDEKTSRYCPKRQYPSREDAERELAEVDEYLAQCSKAYKAVKEDAKSKFPPHQGGASSIECPICRTGMLQYSVASINGHIHARCSTHGCVSWTE